jgi:hypothetical protein
MTSTTAATSSEWRRGDPGLRAGKETPLRFYPTPEQAAELSRTFGCVRKVYNLALEARTAAWDQRQERVTYLQSGVRPVLGLPGPLPQVQVAEEVSRLGGVHPVGVPVPRRPAAPREDDRTAGRGLVAPAAGRRRAVHGDRQPGSGRPLVRGPAVPVRGRAPSGQRYGRRRRRGDHVPGHPLDRGEDRQPPARKARPGTARAGAAADGPHAEGLREPGQGPAQGRAGACPDL